METLIISRGESAFTQGNGECLGFLLYTEFELTTTFMCIPHCGRQHIHSDVYVFMAIVPTSSIV